MDPTSNTSQEKRERPRETGKILYDYELKNAPGKSIIGLELYFDPDGWTPPHRHGGATVVALITEGRMLSGMNGNPPKVYGPGESFVELPGCHHTVGENYSKTEPLKAIATFIIDTEYVKKAGYAGLVVLDEEEK